jgi:hypothetical protein
VAAILKAHKLRKRWEALKQAKKAAKAAVAIIDLLTAGTCLRHLDREADHDLRNHLLRRLPRRSTYHPIV